MINALERHDHADRAGPRDVKRMPSSPRLFAAAPAPRENEALGDFAYRVLRDAIRSGHLQAGVHLREVDVARWLKISRTPVREAFHRIVSEGLFTAGPWNGVMLAELSRQQLIDVHAVRESLEGTAAAIAAKNASDAEIQNLTKLHERGVAFYSDPEKSMIANNEFHRAIHAAAHNPYLLQSLSPAFDALAFLQLAIFVIAGTAEIAQQEHDAVLNAIRRRLPHEAEKAMRYHVRHALELRLELSPPRD